jgi:hypothetical protein
MVADEDLQRLEANRVMTRIGADAQKVRAGARPSSGPSFSEGDRGCLPQEAFGCGRFSSDRPSPGRTLTPHGGKTQWQVGGFLHRGRG